MRQLNKWQREQQAQDRLIGAPTQLKRKRNQGLTGATGIPVAIKKGRNAPKWQKLNETQKLNKSLQIIKSLYGNITHRNLLSTKSQYSCYHFSANNRIFNIHVYHYKHIFNDDDINYIKSWFSMV